MRLSRSGQKVSADAFPSNLWGPSELIGDSRDGHDGNVAGKGMLCWD